MIDTQGLFGGSFIQSLTLRFRKTYLVCLFLSEHQAMRSLHLSWSLAILRAPCHLTPISSRSSLNVLRHVFFGLPNFLLPSSGTQYIAVCASLSLCSRRMWPAIFLLLVVTMSWNWYACLLRRFRKKEQVSGLIIWGICDYFLVMLTLRTIDRYQCCCHFKCRLSQVIYP